MENLNRPYTIQEIKDIYYSDEYKHVRENEHVTGKELFVAVAGSTGYNLMKQDGSSDLDIRGVVENTPEEILGFEKFENLTDSKTDTTFYSVSSFIKLLMENNPNIIELLGLDPEYYLEISPIGQKILDNKDLFVSKRVYYTFGGYALAQLRKIDNVLSKKPESLDAKETNIMNSSKRFQRSLPDEFKDNGDKGLHLYLGPSTTPDKETELYAKVNVDVPVRKFHEIIKSLTDIIRTYENTGHRNRKKDDEHMAKHMSHLVRLYRMGEEILLTGEIKTTRHEDREELLAIKNGKYLNPDGTCKEEFREFVKQLENNLEEAYKKSTLPEKPDAKKIQKLLIEINKEILDKSETPLKTRMTDQYIDWLNNSNRDDR